MTRMNSIDDETLSAWLDGELAPADSDRVAAAVAADPALAARADQHRTIAAGLREAFNPLLKDGPAPPRFGDVVDLNARRELRARPQFGLPQWTAMAATLLLGVVIGGPMLGGGGAGPVTVEQGRMLASGDLGRALDVQLASVPASEPVRIGLSFKDRRGQYCRSFTAAGASGLACRDGEDWRVEGMFAAPAGQGGDYRMAAGGDPRLAELIDQRIAGEPLNAAGEAAAQKAGWR
jgi:hypothetical protein